MINKSLYSWIIFLFLLGGFLPNLFSKKTAQDILCTSISSPIPIPGQGETLDICLQDENAPDNAFVYEVNIKVGLENVNYDDFEFQITRNDSKTIQSFVPEIDKPNQVIYFSDIHLFDGITARGTWVLKIKNVKSYDEGRITAVSLMAYYSKDGKNPEDLVGEGKPTILQISENARKLDTINSVESTNISDLNTISMTMSTSQITIMTEDFEYIFPPSGSLWSVYDLYPASYGEIYWDDDDYRSYDGSWSAWPAKGGPDGVEPPYYRPNMNSWMVYGPFSLSDGESAEFNFMLYHQIEETYDYLFYGVSTDGSNFTGQTISGYSTNWSLKTYSLDNYLCEDQVWIAWKFYSDSIMEYAGPWVDAINLTYEPGQISANGNFSYVDRFDAIVPGKELRVQLWDEDEYGDDDLLAETYTDENGYYSFPAIINWDMDEYQLLDPDSSRLDLYVKWRLANEHYKVENLNGYIYGWYSVTVENKPSGTFTINAQIIDESTNQKAIWIYNDIRKTRSYFLENTYPSQEPGFLTARWTYDIETFLPCDDSCFLAINPFEPFVFISESSTISSDIVVHELAHHIMFNRTGQWLWYEFSCFQHQIFISETQQCAWSEGWADFLPLMVNNDYCYDFGIGPCFGTYLDMENHNRNDDYLAFDWGDNVEGRVAGTLYDFVDSTNENPYYDTTDWLFDTVVDTALIGDGVDTFYEFWQSYQGVDKHNGIRSLYQNTIEYNNPPNLIIPNLNVLEGISYSRLIDLWALANDEESFDDQLTFQIVNAPDYHCGISLDSNHWININPVPSWIGSCSVAIEVNDSLDTFTDWFEVNVMEIISRSYLPIIFRE